MHNSMEQIEKKLTSKQFRINVRDIAQSCIMTFLGAFITSVANCIGSSLSTGEFNINPKYVIAVSIGAGVTHLVRKFLQDESGEIKIFKKWQL